jgi:deoxyribonuclease-1-like protein
MTYQIYCTLSQAQHHISSSSNKTTYGLISILFTLCFNAIAWAEIQPYDSYEFNQEQKQWHYTMSSAHKIDSGWRFVKHDREGSISPNPSTAYKAVEWRLERTIKVNDLAENYLRVKSYFKGHSYQDFTILLEDQFNQTHILHQQVYADAEPQNRIFDIKNFHGQELKLILQLRKSAGIKEQKVGLYIHGVTLFNKESLHIDPLKIAAFNIQIFGQSKMNKPQVVDALLEIIPEFDVILIQEIRDASGEALLELMDLLNQAYPGEFAVTVSARLGRTRSKEQYAYIYRINELQLLEANEVSDPEDHFERPPYIAHFHHIDTHKELIFVGAHLSPSLADDEIQSLSQVIDHELDQLNHNEELFVMGDFNADCRYLNRSERAISTLLHNDYLTSYIHDDIDTTTSNTHCAYDRLLSTIDSKLQAGEDDSYVNEAGVYAFDQIFQYDELLTRAISDHYPVWAEVQLNMAH